MEAATLLEYPEFILAAVAGGALLVVNSRQPAGATGWDIPVWLSDMGTSLVGFLPAGYGAWLSKKLLWSGYRNNSSLGTMLSIKVIATLLVTLTALFLPVYAILLAMPAAFVIPDLVLLIMCKRRQKQIGESLPQALDLMVLCVDAGLGLDATLQRVTSEKSTVAKALNDELLTLSRDVLLGMERERAYAELYKRTGVDELKSLASALNQAGKLGLSIAKILRNQSEFLRMKQGQKAEENAHKLPIYMAFPLWFCIMPALLILVLAPSLIRFIQQAQPGMLP
jgi:tight adherence protein C